MNIFENLVSRYRIKPKTNIQTVKIDDADYEDDTDEILPIINIKAEEEQVSASELEASGSQQRNVDMEMSDTPDIIELDSDPDAANDDIVVLEDLTVIDDTGSPCSPAAKKCRRSSSRASRSAQASFLDGSLTVVDETFASTPGTSSSKKKARQRRRRSSAPAVNSPISPPTTSEMMKAVALNAFVPTIKDIDLLTKMTRINHQNQVARYWEYVQKLSGLKRKKHLIQDVRVCTYNVLCQKTTERTGYLYNHLENGDPSLQWDKRWSLFRDELNMLDADILCLQEVQHDHYEEYFKPHLQRLGYQCFYKRKTGTEYFDGCAFFFRCSKFELLSKRDLEYFVNAQCMMDRPQIAQIFRLRCLKTKKELVFANTHLIFNNTRGDIKFGQAMMLMANVHKELRDNGECPVILMGDFNMEVHSYVYQYFQYSKADIRGIPRNELSGQGKKGGPVIDASQILPSSLMIGTDSIFRGEVEILEKAEETVVNKFSISHPLKLTSVYSDMKPTANKTPISTFHKEFGNPDFIFYSVKDKNFSTAAMTESVFENQSLRLLRRLSLPTLQMMRATLGPWPNKFIPSDHIPLVADFLVCS